MSTTGKLSVIRSIDSTEVEKLETNFVQMELATFSASMNGKNPSINILYDESLEDGPHTLDLNPDTWRKLEYVSKEGKTFRATGTVKVTVLDHQSRQEGTIDAILTDTEGREFLLKGSYDGHKPL